MRRVVVFGNQKLAIDCLNIIISNKDIELVAVVGCETKKDLKQGYPSLRDYCKKKKLKFFNPEKLDNQFLKKFKSLKPDLCFGLMYRNYFNRQYLKIPKMGIINFHPALLPKYRGPIPWVWAMLNGEEEVGLTMHYMDEGIDTGDVIAQTKVRVNDNVTGFELLYLLMNSGVNLFKSQLPLILAGQNKRLKQNEDEASYYGPFDERIRYINWFEQANQLIRRINVVTRPYDGAVANLMSYKMIIWQAEKIKVSNNKLRGPGKIIKYNKDQSFIVTCVDGYLLIKDYDFQCPSGKIRNILKEGNKFS